MNVFAPYGLEPFIDVFSLLDDDAIASIDSIQFRLHTYYIYLFQLNLLNLFYTYITNVGMMFNMYWVVMYCNVYWIVMYCVCIVGNNRKLPSDL